MAAQIRESRLFANVSRDETRSGNAVNGMLLALAGLPTQFTSLDRPIVAETSGALAAATLVQREWRVLRGHDGPVNSAAFSLDGQRVVTASEDGTARIWNTASGTQLGVLRGHRRPVNSAAFSPDGERVVTASTDRTARLWNGSGTNTVVLRGHGGPVITAAFSPDGHSVLTASEDGTSRLWDAASGQQRTILRAHEGGVCCAAFSWDGKRVVTASDDFTTRIWDAASVSPARSCVDMKAEVIAPPSTAMGSVRSRRQTTGPRAFGTWRTRKRESCCAGMTMSSGRRCSTQRGNASLQYPTI
jgi:WD40 repeat protein